MDYATVRAAAGTWGLVLLVVAVIAVVAWVFRPGARKSQDDAARSIFRNEDKPKDDSNGG